MNKESFTYIVFFTFASTFVFVFLISLADAGTMDRVAENQEIVRAMAFLNAIGKPEDNPDKALSGFSAFFGDADTSKPIEAVIDGEDIIVKGFSGQGLWGTITGVLAVRKGMDRFVGIDIMSHSETPGLGARIEEDWFKNQFRGEVIPEDGLTIRKGEGGVDEDYDNGIVDGITGASLTGSFMQKILNREIKDLRERSEEL